MRIFLTIAFLIVCAAIAALAWIGMRPEGAREAKALLQEGRIPARPISELVESYGWPSGTKEFLALLDISLDTSARWMPARWERDIASVLVLVGDDVFLTIQSESGHLLDYKGSVDNSKNDPQICRGDAMDKCEALLQATAQTRPTPEGVQLKAPVEQRTGRYYAEYVLDGVPFLGGVLIWLNRNGDLLRYDDTIVSLPKERILKISRERATLIAGVSLKGKGGMSES